MMKRRLTLIALTCLTTSLLAQTTLTLDLQPRIGETYSLSLSNMVPEEPAVGANLTWDYTAFNNTSPLLTYVLIDPNTTPRSDSFPNSNMAAEVTVLSSPPGYAYYENTSTGINYLGSDFSTQGLDVVTILEDPQSFDFDGLTLGETVSDGYAQRTLSMFNTSFASGFTSYEYAGYGTLELPTATIEDVVLIYQVDVLTDTVEMPFITQVILDSTRTYAWVDGRVEFPICQWQETKSYTVTIIDGIFSDITLSEEEESFGYNPAIMSSDYSADLAAAETLTVYPTMHRSQVTITSSDSESEVVIFSMDGLQVGTLDLTGGTTKSMDISDYPPGRYVAQQGKQLASFVKLD